MTTANNSIGIGPWSFDAGPFAISSSSSSSESSSTTSAKTTELLAARRTTLNDLIGSTPWHVSSARSP